MDTNNQLHGEKSMFDVCWARFFDIDKYWIISLWIKFKAGKFISKRNFSRPIINKNE